MYVSYTTAHWPLHALPRDIAKYEGKYELRPGFVITITSKEQKLFAQATGQPQFELFAESPTKFFLKVVTASVEFHQDEQGNTNALTLFQGGREMKANKRSQKNPFS